MFKNNNVFQITPNFLRVSRRLGIRKKQNSPTVIHIKGVLRERCLLTILRTLNATPFHAEYFKIGTIMTMKVHTTNHLSKHCA